MLIAVATLGLLLAIGLLFGNVRLIEVILLLRAAADPVLNWSKEAGRSEMGVGAVLNVVVIGAALCLILTQPRVRIRQAALVWLPFLAATLIAVPIAPEPNAAARLFLVLVSHASFFVIAFYLVRTPDDLRRYCLLVIASSILPALTGFAQLALGMAETEDGTRVSASFAHPNIFAEYILIILSLVLFCINDRRSLLSRQMRQALTLYVPVLFGLLVLTKTRSAWVGGALILALQAMIYDRRYFGYFLLLPLILLASPEILERFTDLEQGNVNENYAKLNSYAWRELLWQSGLAWAAERPVLGYGLESFSYHVAEFFPVPLGDAGTTDAHSVFVQLIFETGGVGLAAYVWSFVLVLARLVRWTRSNSAAGMFIGLVAAYLAMAYADNLLYYLTPNWYFWFVLGCFFSVSERKSSGQTADASVVRRRPRPVPSLASQTPG